MTSYDITVVGSGPGGHAAALAASRSGLRVAVVERGPLGGVCLNVGCIPTKALLAAAHTMRKIRGAAAMGIQVGPVSLAYEVLMARNQRIIEQCRHGLVALLRAHRVELLVGDAVFEDAHTLRVTHEAATQTVSSERFIIATGASPSPGPWAFDGRQVLSYRELLALPALPSSLLIIGGGVIGCEFASCFADFGVPVTVVEQQAQLLPMEDPEAVRLIAHRLAAQGVRLMTGTTVKQLSASADKVAVTWSSGETSAVSHVLIAIGQRPNSCGLGVEPLGIATERGIAVDEFLRTTQPHIAAIGDCLAGHGLAHLASAEGGLAVRNLTDATPAALNRRLVPRCVFTDPELAHVGLLESEATASVRVSRFSFAALGKSLCDEEREGFAKLLVDSTTDRVVGATIVGAQASTLIHQAVLAIQHGLTAKQLTHSITAHPTLPEALTEAAAQFSGEALYTKGSVRAPRTVSSGMQMEAA